MSVMLLILPLAAETYPPGKFKIRYRTAQDKDHKKLSKVLKQYKHLLYNDAVDFLNSLYILPRDVEIVVEECGSRNSRYNPDRNRIYICYESLQYKIDDYKHAPKNENIYWQRVFDNSVFTFWHEVGHAIIHQYDLPRSDGALNHEDLADEFAVISMMLRQDKKWMNAITISALHFKNEDTRSRRTRLRVNGDMLHSPDRMRYYNILCLLYGFRPDTFDDLKSRLDLEEGGYERCVEYFRSRYTFWADVLKPEYMKRPYFTQRFD